MSRTEGCSRSGCCRDATRTRTSVRKAMIPFSIFRAVVPSLSWQITVTFSYENSNCWLPFSAERTMISKLKENAGFSFTNKLEGMFNDMATSQEIIQKFKDYTAAPAATVSVLPGFEMAVQVRKRRFCAILYT